MKGTGLTTGEEVEQINIHLSRMGRSTKHQLPEGIYFSFILEGMFIKLYLKIKKIETSCKCLDGFSEFQNYNNTASGQNLSLLFSSSYI